jgi:hypothetical protein
MKEKLVLDGNRHLLAPCSLDRLSLEPFSGCHSMTMQRAFPSKFISKFLDNVRIHFGYIAGFCSLSPHSDIRQIPILDHSDLRQIPILDHSDIRQIPILDHSDIRQISILDHSDIGLKDRQSNTISDIGLTFLAIPDNQSLKNLVFVDIYIFRYILLLREFGLFFW